MPEPDLLKTQGATEAFGRTFQLLTGHAPFPWQEKLFEKFLQGEIPPSCNLPTGLGKTSVVAIWLIALANGAKVPRRLVYVVNRRTVVDQATREAEKLRENLGKAGLTEPLKGLCAFDHEIPLAISTLRGQFADNGEWAADPARPAVIVGTVDMIGSRLLFSGYGIGFKRKPLHAGFLGQDVLLVHDEAHLEPAFQRLIEAIRDEQRREQAPLGEEMRLKVVELTATSRRHEAEEKELPFGLTEEEQSPPAIIPDPPTEPIHHVWHRLKAKKSIAFHTPQGEKEKIADHIGKLAMKYADNNSGKAILVFVSSLENHAIVCKALSGENVQVLTGTLRGLERDRMADPRKETGCPIFARFLKPPQPDASEDEKWKVTPKLGTVFLICTSAGEVGIDISADHMICDLVAFDRMVQRLGRVNRFGTGDAKIDIVHEATPDKKNQNEPNEQVRWKTLELLEELPHANGHRLARPLALMQLRQREDLKAKFESACTPPPTILPVSDILFDAWALTTIRGKLPGRPPVQPYLHGVEDEKTAETYIAWRQEVWELRRDCVDNEDRKQFQEFAAELLEDYPLKPHELLRDSTFRRSSGIRDKLAKLAETNGQLPAWIHESDGNVIVATLSEIADRSLAGRTVILPPQAGGLMISEERSMGLLDGTTEHQPDYKDFYDVADKWTDDKDRQRRVRVWDDDPQYDVKIKGMRPIREIRFQTDEENEDAPGRLWRWFERPDAADNEGSKFAQKPVLWQVHTDDVANKADAIAGRLPLPDGVREAVVLAAQFHDCGKRRPLFQRILGNFNLEILLAKSGRKNSHIPEKYRHEFGSLLDIQEEPEFQRQSDEMKDLILHLIAAGHGRGRPHFPTDEAFDPERKSEDVDKIAIGVVQRFARLQHKYGRWGLAYLESLLRAADWAASAEPSEFVTDTQEVSP
jgi:CRISPR-associated endonuclease/helicase Cas3